MMKQRRFIRVVLGAALLSLVLISCGSKSSADDDNVSSTTTQGLSCSVFQEPPDKGYIGLIEYMEKNDLSFAEVVVGDPDSDVIKGLTASLYIADNSVEAFEKGKYKLAIDYMVQMYEPPVPPPPSKRVIENAEKLDRALADGLCE